MTYVQLYIILTDLLICFNSIDTFDRYYIGQSCKLNVLEDEKSIQFNLNSTVKYVAIR